MNRIWLWAAGIGFALFVWIQILPNFVGADENAQKTMSRDAARQAALDVALRQFRLDESRIRNMEVTYLSDHEAVGYIVKHKVVDAYNKNWDAKYPLDTYRVDITLAEDAASLTLYLHPDSGKLVGWQGGLAAQRAPDPAAPDGKPAALALQYEANSGENADDWIWDGRAMDEAGRWTFLSRQSSGVSEANLVLHVRVPPAYGEASADDSQVWRHGAVMYDIRVPEQFAAYLRAQQKLAGKMNALGFVVPHLLLMIMSIIYATTRRSYTSPRRGLALAALFLLMYGLFYINLFPGLRASLMEDGSQADQAGVLGLFTANLIITGLMALFTYLAAVGGDGLWRSMGRNLWPLWREDGFGSALLAGVSRGYVLALLMLGVQSVIILTLSQTIGLFQSTDAGRSSYNMTVPWLLLLLAWCAGIAEEIQSRLFGIGLFRHWFVDGAARLLGRRLSPRSTAWLTAAAMLPPGLFWAIGHVGYAVYPVYARIIELVILAMLFGWFMLRFGFMAVMFAHIIMNTVLMSVQLLFDGLPGNLAAGLVGPLLPAAVAWLLYRLHRSRINRRRGTALL